MLSLIFSSIPPHSFNKMKSQIIRYHIILQVLFTNVHHFHFIFFLFSSSFFGEGKEGICEYLHGFFNTSSLAEKRRVLRYMIIFNYLYRALMYTVAIWMLLYFKI